MTDQYAATAPIPTFALLVMCVECDKGLEVPLPLDQHTYALHLAQHAWFVAVMSPPGQSSEVPILFGALCTHCAPTIFPPETMKDAEARRQQLMASHHVQVETKP
jgi:hypothetical protein